MTIETQPHRATWLLLTAPTSLMFLSLATLSQGAIADRKAQNLLSILVKFYANLLGILGWCSIGLTKL